jgi:FlaG/FlaF family flagellin (archaellin)
MRFTQHDNRGMSAFGAVLLVMLTTFLLLGTAALYFGGLNSDYEQVDPPSVTLTFDYVENPTGDEAVVIQHVRGGHINPEQLRVEMQGATCTGDHDPNGVYNGHDDFGLGTDNWLTAGNALTLDGDNPEPLCPEGRLAFDEVTIDVVWLNPSGTDVTLGSWDAQEAE